MRSKYLVAALLVFCIVSFSTATEAEPVAGPYLKAGRITTPPKIDGRLNDSAWKEATMVTDFQVAIKHELPSAPTEAWVGSDGRFLYVAFRCHDARLRELVNKKTKRDSGIHQDDSVEIFLDPGTDGRTYLHFLLSIGNIQADQLVIRGGRYRDWNASWESATFADPVLLPGEGWVAEMAIPLYVFRKYARKDGPWRINLCRNKQTPPQEFSSWSPVDGGFHEPQSFGRMVGLSDIRPTTAFLPLILSCRVSHYRMINGKYAYEVIGEVFNDGGHVGMVEFVIEDTPFADKLTQTCEKITLSPTEIKQFQLTVPIEQPGKRQVTLALRCPETGEIWQKVRIVDIDALNPLHTYLDRNYYTTETRARVLASVAMNDSECRQAGLRISAALLDEKGKGAEAQEEVAASDEVAVELSISDIRAGEYPVRVELIDRSNIKVGTVTLMLTKRDPAPQGVNEVKIDHENRALLLNGKPFFPVGITANRMSPEFLKQFQYMGFNTILRWWGIGRDHPVSRAIKTLNAAHDYGLYMIEGPMRFLHHRLGHNGVLKPEGMAQAIKDMPDFLQAVRNHPALLAYFGLDESPRSGLDEQLKTFLRTVHEIDPYHPLLVAGGGAAKYARYDFGDILGDSFYWCPLGADLTTPDVVARGTKRMFENVTEPHQGPLFNIPQSELTSLSRRPHSPRERRINIYLAVIHGSKAIIYFTNPPIHLRQTVENMKELSSELHKLAPALLKRSPPQEIVVNPAPPYGELPIVQALFKDRPGGGALLIAGNSNLEPVEARWDVSSLGRKLHVSNFFTRKKFKVRKGAFTDNFDAYGTRVYLIQGGERKKGEKAVINLILSGKAVEAMKEKMRPRPEPARHNLVANPGFEEEGTGWKSSAGTAVISFPIEGRNGNRCLKISKTDAKTAINIIADPITVKPNTTMLRHGGWVRSKLTEGRTSGSFYINEIVKGSAKPRVGSGIPVKPTQGKWRMISRKILVPEEEMKAKVWYHVPREIVGEIWLDDVFVEEAPAKIAVKPPKNMILNSSFEEAGVPGWPDSWWIGYAMPDQMIGDPDGAGQDDTRPYHGKYSLRIVNPFDKANGFPHARYIHKFGSQCLRGGTPVKVGATYVFSAYMRADKKGTKADLLLCNFAFNRPLAKEGVRKIVTLTTDWKRYQIACTIPEEGWTRGLRHEVTVYIYHCRTAAKSCIWVDAVQLEEGREATEYTQDDYRVKSETRNARY